MFFLSLLYLSTVRLEWNVYAFPLDRVETNEAFTSVDPRALNFLGTRSIYNIIWSCFLTIFACTWIAVHSNVPAPSDKSYQVFSRRLAIMGYLLIAPELVIFWASRQYSGARVISKRYKERGWTTTHAYLLIMGGFSLHSDGKFLRTLDVNELEKLAASGQVEWPTITEAEIEDRSKGDFLSKGAVILQTAWFIIQIIARGINHLVVTELEVVTLAFAALTSIIYWLWWHKPLDIRCSVAVHLRPNKLVEEGTQKTLTDELALPMTFSSQSDVVDAEYPFPTSSLAIESELKKDETCNNDSSTNLGEKVTPEDAKSISSLQKMHKEHGLSAAILYGILIVPFQLFFSPIHDMLNCTSLAKDGSRVLTFYSPDIENTETLGYIIAIPISIIFGGIHCIAWSFVFPTFTERWIWRINAVIISALPITICTASVFLAGLDYESPEATIWAKAASNGAVVVAMGSLLLYIAARIALLVLPFMALRSLPEGAYVDIEWTAFFPHFGS